MPFVFGAICFRCFVYLLVLTIPQASVEDGDALLTEQFSLLAGALQDPVPAVRVAAVQAVLRVLDRYWELVPPSETAALAKTIFGTQQHWLVRCQLVW